MCGRNRGPCLRGVGDGPGGAPGVAAEFRGPNRRRMTPASTCDRDGDGEQDTSAAITHVCCWMLVSRPCSDAEVSGQIVGIV